MSDWLTLKNKGNDEYKRQNYQSAIAFYTEAIEKNPGEDVLFSNRALCYSNLKKTRKALFDLEKAVSLNPTNVKAIKRLYAINLALGEFGVRILH